MVGSTENIRVEYKGNVVIITMTRPQVLNALNYETVTEMENIFIALEEDRNVLGVIITGEGRGFVSGADIAEIYEMREGASPNATVRFMDYQDKVHRTFNRLARLPRPVIAAVNGYALGGGCELAMCADLIIASTKAQFGLPEGKLGLMPTYMGTQRLPRMVGRSLAKEMMFTSRFIGGEEAATAGLACKCVSPEELLPAAEAMMGTILKRGPVGVRYMKTAVDRGMDMPFDDAVEFERALGGLCLATEDCAEGVAAFLEKREPVFHDQ